MSKLNSWMRGFVLASAGTAVLWGVADQRLVDASALASDDDERQHARPSSTKSSPIAITSDNRFVWSVNPDNNSVSVFNVADGREPEGGGDPGRERAVVRGHHARTTCRRSTSTNMVSGTVSVIDADDLAGGQDDQGRNRAVRLRADPRREQALCRQPVLGRRVGHRHPERTAWSGPSRSVGPKPHGVAITADGTKVYVTQFLAQMPADDPRPLTQSEGADDGREGRVTVIDARTQSGDQDRRS